MDKSQILKDNKDKAGVYLWTHKESGKIYVGSSVNLFRRLGEYYSFPKLDERNSYIHNAIKLYKYSAFFISIVEYINITNLPLEDARKLIISREQYYINTLEPDYNILKLAGSVLGYRHTADSIDKIKIAATGRFASPETKIKLSKAKTGANHPFFGKSHSLEALDKISLANSKNLFVYTKDPDSNEMILYKSFNSYTKAGKSLDSNR
jgi:group I intron endonuclease